MSQRNILETGNSYGMQHKKKLVCEVCGKPATTAIRDMQEIPSEKGYRDFEPKGDPHFFCDKCKREPKRYSL